VESMAPAPLVEVDLLRGIFLELTLTTRRIDETATSCTIPDDQPSDYCSELSMQSLRFM
jgi:hypothetical protein